MARSSSISEKTARPRFLSLYTRRAYDKRHNDYGYAENRVRFLIEKFVDEKGIRRFVLGRGTTRRIRASSLYYGLKDEELDFGRACAGFC